MVELVGPGQRHQQSLAVVCHKAPWKIQSARVERFCSNSFLSQRLKMKVFALSDHWVVLAGRGHNPEDAESKRSTRENKRFRVSVAWKTSFFSRNRAPGGHLVELVGPGQRHQQSSAVVCHKAPWKIQSARAERFCSNFRSGFFFAHATRN